MKKLLLIDGNNVMFRAYFATAAMGNLMMNHKGFPTNMVYGFINIVNRFMNEDYTHVAVAFDAGKETRRHKAYADYKAGRAKTPEELIMQIPYIHKFLEAYNINYYLSSKYEADDIIASIHDRFLTDFDEVHVLSNDNDLFQLIGDNSYQLYTKSKETIKYSKEVLFEEKGITPNQVPDYKGLIGDKSDNLLGVEGIGPVGASKLLKEYGTLEGIYENIDSVKGKTKEKLELGHEQALFTKDMATLDPTFDLPLSLDELSIKEPDYEKLKELYDELEFQSLIKKLPRKSVKAEFNYREIDNPMDVDCVDYDGINYLVLDTLGDNYHTAPKVGFGITNSKGSFYIPYDIGTTSFDFLLFLSDERIKKSVYDYKKMYVALLNDDITLNGVVEDTLLSSYILNPDIAKMELNGIASQFGYQDLLSDEQVYSKKGKETLPEEKCVYMSHIAKKSFALSIISPLILDEVSKNNQLSLLNDVEIPFSRVLGNMEKEGLRVDEGALDEYENKILSELSEVEKEVYSLAGHEFNILSPKQLGTVLFDELMLPYRGKKNKSGGYSTDQATLDELKWIHPIVERCLRYRTLSKLESTYVIGVKTAINEKGDSHIHTIYKQALTDTGRLSSTEPNLQNLPARNKESSEFRKIFIPEDGCYLLSSDYSQIELRVLAHMSNDENLKNAFLSGSDIHEATAKAILKKDSVTKEERSKAKAVNFGIIYGISAWGLSNDIGIPQYEAQDFINGYHETFPGIKPFTDSLIEGATNNGYVETIYGRRRYIRDINSSQYFMREFAKRTAMNAPIQGTAADILKIAMVKIDKAIKEECLHAKLILTIHDEVVLNVPTIEIEKTKELVERVMSSIELNVPLLVESGYGKTLYEAK